MEANTTDRKAVRLRLLLVMLVSNLFALGGIYSWIFAAQCAWYGCAAAGHMVSKRTVVIPPMVTVDEPRRAA